MPRRPAHQRNGDFIRLLDSRVQSPEVFLWDLTGELQSASITGCINLCYEIIAKTVNSVVVK